MSDEKNSRELSTNGDKKPEVKKVSRPAKKRLTADGINLWFREMRSELKKVVWPTPKQVLSNSVIVAVAVLVVGTLIAVYDMGAEALVKAVIMSFR